MGVDHALFGCDALQRVELAAQFSAFRGRLVALLRLCQYLSDASNIVDEGLLRGPLGFQASELLPERRDIRIEVCHAICVVDSQIAVAVERGSLCLARDNGDTRVLDQGRRRSEEHTSELQSQFHLVCRLLLEKKKK